MERSSLIDFGMQLELRGSMSVSIAGFADKDASDVKKLLTSSSEGGTNELESDE